SSAASSSAPRESSTTAGGTTNSCGAAATRSRPAPPRSCGTSSPSACSGSPEADERRPLMDFTFTEDQTDLKRQARAWRAERHPLARGWGGEGGRAPGQAGGARPESAASGGAGSQDDRWPELAKLGWLDVAEADLGFIEEALLLEEMGYACYPGPY